MKKWRVTIYYCTKRNSVAAGMTIDAPTEEEATEKARKKVLSGYRARHFIASMAEELSNA